MTLFSKTQLLISTSIKLLVNNVFEIGVTCSTGKNDAAAVVEVVAAAVVAVAAGGA